MSFIKTTESSSYYDGLEKMTIGELLSNINREDQTVPLAVEKVLPQIESLTEQVIKQIRTGGRLFYIGAGTSGRLGIVDASECPPTFGVPFDLVNGLIAGGDQAIRKAVENAEDNTTQAQIDLENHHITSKDFVIGIAASGTTPYVLGGLKFCKKQQIPTGCIVCNVGSPIATTADFPVEVIVGPEFVTGSSRMKAGTAQKLILNMISTATMIQLGHVKGNKMVDMKLSNDKLVSRAIEMVQQELKVDFATAEQLITSYGNVRNAIDKYNSHDNK